MTDTTLLRFYLDHMTKEELIAYQKIEQHFAEQTDDFIDRCITAIHIYIDSYQPTEYKKAYNRLYYYAQKFQVKPHDFLNWWNIGAILYELD